jgi:hypothetical protein
MPLLPEERERIRETESLKAEIRKEIEPEHPESRFSKFFRHEAVLLLLGFGLTTVAGGVLTHYWKAQEWNNQQRYLARQRALDKKYALMDKTFKEVASTTTAAQDVLNLYYGTHWTDADIKERLDYWKKTSRGWREASNLLKQSLATNFSNQAIVQTFDQLIQKRRLLGNDIGNLPPLRQKPKASRSRKPVDAKKAEAELAARISADNNMVNEILGLLKQCGELMKSEMQSLSPS